MFFYPNLSTQPLTLSITYELSISFTTIKGMLLNIPFSGRRGIRTPGTVTRTSV